MHDKKIKPKKRNGPKSFFEIQQFIDELFDDMREEITQITSDWMKPSFYRNERRLKGINQDCLCPLVDIRENSEKYKIMASLPGVISRDDIELVASDNKSISITAKLEKPIPIKKFSYISQQNAKCGRYHREINFLKPIDHDNISAKFNNGILDIDICKKVRRKRINVE